MRELPKVFISYSHDSEEHANQVLNLANQLRKDGVDAEIDQYHNLPAERWPAWFEKNIMSADFVLIVCTKRYQRYLENSKDSHILWESHIIRQILYDNQSPSEMFIPVLLAHGTSTSIPPVLRSLKYYSVDTPEGYEQLYRHLTGQPRSIKPDFGQRRRSKPQSWGTFEDFDSERSDRSSSEKSSSGEISSKSAEIQPEISAPLGGNTSDHVRYFAKFDGDISHSETNDYLNIEPDVQAFAELICLRETPQPLSIAILGQWGSGKTFFMEKLSSAIEHLTTDSKGDANSPFASNVIQIKFNAWSYVDSNIWASLTAEFFDQLRVGGYKNKGVRRYADLVAKVAADVARTELTVATLRHKQKEFRNHIDDVDDKIAKLENKKKKLTRVIVSAHAGKFFERFLDTHRAEINEAGKALGLGPELSNDIEELRRIAANAVSWTGRLWLWVRAFWRSIIGLVGVVVLLLGLIIAATIFGWDQTVGITWLSSSFARLSTQGISVIAAILVMLPTMRRIHDTLAPVFEAGEHLADDLKAKRQQIDEEIAEKGITLRRLQEGEKSAGERIAEQEAFLNRYQHGISDKSPASILEYFLMESGETVGYEKHLGVVSRVRRAFESLDSIVKAQKNATERYECGNNIDRIVLFIDDLDRCRDRQVIEVLEAIHLLLAFDLFVVVVGVDVRWLKHSLHSFYGQQLTSGREQEDEKASVTDYLEKIFQIPFWLRPMTFDREGAGAGTYETLIDGLVGTPAERGVPPLGTTEDDKSEGRSSSDEDSPSSVDKLTLGTGLTSTSSAAVRRQIELTVAELNLMKALGPMVGRSPRSTKRFINIYRLIKARKNGNELDEFLMKISQESGKNKAIFPTVMLMLAVDMCYDPDQFSQFIKLINDYNVPITDKILTHSDIISTINAVLGRALTTDEMHPACREVCRYSFRKYN